MDLMEGVIPWRLICEILARMSDAWANLSLHPEIMSLLTYCCSSSVMAEKIKTKELCKLNVESEHVSLTSECNDDVRA